MKTDFINNMTHEFKTPISTIGVASEMLLKDEISRDVARTKKYASVILSENLRLQNQVEQVLQSAILEKGDVKLRLKSTDIHKLIHQTVENFQFRINEKQGRLVTSLEAIDYMVVVDRHHIINVLANLIDNAIKYSVNTPSINLSSSSNKHHLIVRVADEGIGISKEDQKHIFKNLYRVHTGDIHDVKGFGIGLFYVYKILELHGGRIELESEPGKGSVFSMFLPLNHLTTTSDE